MHVLDTLPAHSTGYVALAFVRGNRVASCGPEGAVAVWDTSSTPIRLESKETVHDGAIRALAFHPQGSRLATVSEDRTTRTLSFPALQVEGTVLRSGVGGRAASFSASGLLAVGGDDETVAVIDSEKKTRTLKVATSVLSLAFSPVAERLAVATADGFVRVHAYDKASGSFREEFSEQLFPKKAVASFQGSCQVLFNSAGSTLAVAGGPDVAVINTSSWKQKQLRNPLATGLTTQSVSFNSEGTMLAVSRGQSLEIWSVGGTKLLESYDIDGSISSLAPGWTASGAIVLADNVGNLMMMSPSVEADLSSSQPEAADDIDLAAAEGEEEYTPHVVAENLPRREEGAPEVLSGPQLGEEQRKEMLAEIDDTPEPINYFGTDHVEPLEAPACAQQPFQPGATPKNKTKRRFLAFNMTGCIITKEEEDRSNIEMEWWDVERHRPIKFVDRFNFDTAAMGEEGAVFACGIQDDRASHIFYKVFDAWANNSDWTYKLPEGEEAFSLAIGSGWIAAATDRRYLRIITSGGVQCHIICLTQKVIAMAGSGNLLAVVTHQSVPVNGDHLQTVTVYEISKTSMKKLYSEMLPLSVNSRLRWIGFGPLGLGAFDEAGILRVRMAESGTWVPVFDGQPHKDSDNPIESFFMAGFTDTEIYCVHMRNSRWPLPAPRPVTSQFPLLLPFLCLEKESVIFDESMCRGRLAISAMRAAHGNELDIKTAGVQLDKAIIQHMVAWARSKKNYAAIGEEQTRQMDLFDMLELSKSREIVVKMFQTLEQQVLAERMYTMHQSKELAAEQAAVAAPVADSPLPVQKPARPAPVEEAPAQPSPKRVGRATVQKPLKKQKEEEEEEEPAAETSSAAGGNDASESEEAPVELPPQKENKPVVKQKAQNPFAKKHTEKQAPAEKSAGGKAAGTAADAKRKRQVTIGEASVAKKVK